MWSLEYQPWKRKGASILRANQEPQFHLQAFVAAYSSQPLRESLSSTVLKHQTCICHRGSSSASQPSRALPLTPCPPVTSPLDCSSPRNLWGVPCLWGSTRNVPVSLRRSLTWGFWRDKVLAWPLPDLWNPGGGRGTQGLLVLSGSASKLGPWVGF